MDISYKFLALQYALIKVGIDHGFSGKTYENRLKDVLRSCAEQLSASRVSLWLYGEDQNAILCQLLYLATSDSFDSGQILTATQFPSYFNAIRQARLIMASDARSHPATQEFTTDYLEPLGIQSMLDAPIHSSGGLCGVLCIEYTEPVLSWDLAEMAYAVAVADRISLLNTHETWKSEREKIEQLGRVDPRTGLENRAFFLQRVRRHLTDLGNTANISALIIVELDNFNRIDIQWGLDVSVNILAELADRLVKCPALHNCHIGRNSVDTLAFWVPTLSPDLSLDAIIQRIRGEITRPITVHGEGNIKFSTTIGVATLPVPDLDIKDPLRLGEIALSQAKNLAGNDIAYFKKDWYDQYLRRNEMEEQLARGINNNEILPYYQPIVDAQSGRVVGAEALMRWQHPLRGTLLPKDFFPVARESSMMSALGDIMLHKVCHDLNSFRKEHPSLWVSVNLGYEDLYSKTLADHIAELLSEHDLPGDALELEIIEDLVNHNGEIVQSQLIALHNLGIQLAIDDFGKGYSSLSRLKDIPITKLKIDQSFIEGLPGDESNVCITNSILGLAKGLHLSTVGEGVETAEQMVWLRDNGCTYLQGFFLAMPMPFDDFLSTLRDQNR